MLPIEIRLRIWKLSMPTRAVEIYDDLSWPDIMKPFKNPMARANQPPPSVFSICQVNTHNFKPQVAEE